MTSSNCCSVFVFTISFPIPSQVLGIEPYNTKLEKRMSVTGVLHYLYYRCCVSLYFVRFVVVVEVQTILCVVLIFKNLSFFYCSSIFNIIIVLCL